VCTNNTVEKGGVQKIVQATKAELSARGHVVRIITPKPRDKCVSNMENVIFARNFTDFKSPMHIFVQVTPAKNHARR
jgi:uncharacterized protein YbjT (DUF2867 family)